MTIRINDLVSGADLLSLHEADFPAAHSMDSAWFAVDRDGHVAYFSTGEAGAMPGVGVNGDSAYGLLDRLADAALPAGEVIYDPRGHEMPGGKPAGLSGLPLTAQEYPALVFVSSLAPVQSDIEAGRATAVRATEGYAVVLSRVTAEQARRLQDSGVVRSWTFHFPRAGDRADPSTMGLFEYGHLCENWISGPYGRERIPARPLHVDQLPPALRQSLKEATLSDVSFAETVHIQPAEHWACESWEPAWLGLDGKARPFPGREGDFEELRAELPEIEAEEPG